MSRTRLRSVWRAAWPALVAFLGALIFLEIIVRAGWISGYLLPAPSAVGATLVTDRSEYFDAFVNTASSALLGFVAAAVVGFWVALLFSLNDWIERALYPFAVFFQTVPIIAIAPLLVIWFGFGKGTVVVSSFIVGIFPVLAATLVGLRDIRPSYLELFRLHRATRWQILWKLRIPSSLASVVTGLRVAAGLSVIGAVVGEFVAGGGLGGIVDAAKALQRVDKVFAAVLLSTLIGVFFMVIMQVLEGVVRRRGTET